MTEQVAEPEAEVRALIDRWVEAFRTRSVEDAMALHDPAMVSFDIVPPLQYPTRDEYRKAWEAAFDGFEGPIVQELQELSITVGGDVAFSHCLSHFVGTTIEGIAMDYWFRWTACFRRVDGRWLIVHDHTSLPTDFATWDAVGDLQP